MPSNRRKGAWDRPLMSGRKRKLKAKQLVTDGIRPRNIAGGLRRQRKILADAACGSLGTTGGLRCEVWGASPGLLLMVGP